MQILSVMSYTFLSTCGIKAKLCVSKVRRNNLLVYRDHVLQYNPISSQQLYTVYTSITGIVLT